MGSGDVGYQVWQLASEVVHIRYCAITIGDIGFGIGIGVGVGVTCSVFVLYFFNHSAVSIEVFS